MKLMKEYAAMRKADLKEKISKVEFPPNLLILQVGNDEASSRYVRNKIKDCEEVGITAMSYVADENVTTQELVRFIKERQEFFSGIIVQQPLPAHIDQKAIDLAINPKKDVDGFHPMSYFKPATARGIIDYLEWRDFKLEGAEVTVIGRSEIVGKPLAKMLTDRNATVTLCHSKTPRIKLMRHLHNSDLIICAVGTRHFLDCTDLKTNIIDVGINFDDNGKMCGDCYFIGETESSISPVPGGVGLLTRVALLENVVEAYCGV